jgi:uncharacterized repeat protein (TIGR01451 family)
MYNCLLTGNTAGGYGGGCYGCTLNNCTISGNTAGPAYGGYGGGAYSSTLNNCIVYYNNGGAAGPDTYNCSLNYCCAPTATGAGNITNAPLLSFDYHLTTYSPCVNGGNNAYVTTTTDFYGSPRVIGGTVDIGACEEQSATPASGLPSTPTNVTATLQAGRTMLSWSPSAKATSYTIRRSLVSGGAYAILASGIQATNFVDAAVTNGSAYYYVVTAVNAYGESAFSQEVSVYCGAAYLVFGPIASPQTSSVPFVVSISACDSNKVVLTNFNGAVMLSAAGDHGNVRLNSTSTTAFVNGQWTGMITVAMEFPDTNTRLSASSNSLTGVSAPFTVVAPALQPFSLSVNQLIYNPVLQRIYATVPANAPTFSNSVVVIDPVIGRLESSYYLGDDPNKMAVSDNGQFLYVGFNGSNVFRRFNLTSNAVDLQVPLGQDDYYGWPFYAAGMTVLPGMPHSVAITRAAIWQGYEPTVMVFDDGIQRSNVLGIPYNNSFAVRAASSSRLYTGGYFYRVTIDDTGVAAADGHDGLVGFFEDIKYQAGRVYTSGGTVIDGEAAAVVGRLPSCSFTEPDLANGRIFTLASQPVWAQPDAWTLYAFDPVSLQQVGSMPLPGIINCAGNFIRWGTNGLACTTTDVYGNPTQVWLIRTSLVPSGPAADLAITMSDTPNPAILGNTLTYQILVTNKGPGEARVTTLQDFVPSGAELVSATSTVGACIWSNGVVTCNFGTLSNGADAEVTLVVTPRVIGFLTNLAVVSSLSFDSSMSNNSATTVTPTQHAPFAQTQRPWLSGQTSALLNGMSVPNGLPGTTWFEWGTGSNFDQATPATNLQAGGAVVRVSAPVDSLANGVVYQYRLVASNALGTTYGAPLRFTTGRKIVGWGDNSSGQTTIPGGLTNVVSLAAGRYHSLALCADGTVAAWGGNNYGQTNVPANLHDVVAIAAGDSDSMALKSDGTVVAWGQSYAGQANVPAGLAGVIAISQGVGYDMALKADGTLVLWGDNWSNQTTVPLGLSNVVAIAAGYTHPVALKADGTVVSWGYNDSGSTTVPAGLDDVVDVAAGSVYSMALKADGTVVAWGGAGVGQGISNIVAIAANYWNGILLTSDGAVLDLSGHSTGPINLADTSIVAAGVTYALADGDNLPPQAAPQVISSPANQDLTIALSGNDLNGDSLSYRITALPQLGTLYQFTNGARGVAVVAPGSVITDPGHRLIFVPAVNGSGKPYATFLFVVNDGEADSAPATVSLNIGNVYAHTQSPSPIRSNSATLNGMVLANGLASAAWFEWGERGYYTNATSILDAGASSTVVRVSQPITGLRARATYQCRLVVSNIAGIFYGTPRVFSTGSKVSAWGYNVYGQASVPSGLSNVVAVSAGGYFSVALKTDGSVTAWGNNFYRQTNVPSGLSNVVAIASGYEFVLALKADGTVAAWGHNDYGQTNVPVGLSNVVAVAAGSRHSLALKADGTVLGWGWNLYNQTNIPAGVSNVVAVAAGEAHSMVLRADEVILPWGYSAYGLTNVPAGASNVVDIAAKFYDSAALNADGTVAAWGSNNWGQTNVPANLSGIFGVAVGDSYDLALKATGTLVAWGGNSYGQTNVPQGLGDITSMAAGISHSLAVGCNLPPQATSNVVSGLANHDLVISMRGTDPNGDPLRFRVSAQPPTGTLYQFTNGARGDAIKDMVADPGGRVIFAPAMNDYGSPYASFSFVANDGEADSAAAPVTISISPPPAPTITSFGLGTNGACILTYNGDSNTTYCVWASTDLSSWEYLGPTTQIAPGKFLFSDASARTLPRRFYRISTGCLAPAAQFCGYSRVADGNFEVRFNGSTNTAYHVCASTNLTDWQMLGIATEMQPGLFRFLDISATNFSQRFYRVTTP